jgi:hypothetical protein
VLPSPNEVEGGRSRKNKDTFSRFFAVPFRPHSYSMQLYSLFLCLEIRRSTGVTPARLSSLSSSSTSLRLLFRQ